MDAGRARHPSYSLRHYYRYTKRMMNSCCVRATHPMNVVHAAVDFPERLTIVGLDVKGSLGTLARGPDSIQLIVTLA